MALHASASRIHKKRTPEVQGAYSFFDLGIYTRNRLVLHARNDENSWADDTFVVLWTLLLKIGKVREFLLWKAKVTN